MEEVSFDNIIQRLTFFISSRKIEEVSVTPSLIYQVEAGCIAPETEGVSLALWARLRLNLP